MAVKLLYSMNYEKYIDLFVRAGLEISPKEPRPEGLITCFELIEEDTGELLGAAGICYNKEAYILRCVAVEEKARGRGYGKLLVEAVMKEAKSRKADKIWLTAKVPEFYRKFGFHVRPIEEAPFQVKCKECTQFRNGCESEVMVHFFS